MSHVIVHGVMGRFSDGALPTEILVNTQHITFWHPTGDDHVLIHFLHGSGIEISETLTEVQDLIHIAEDQL